MATRSRDTYTERHWAKEQLSRVFLDTANDTITVAPPVDVEADRLRRLRSSAEVLAHLGFAFHEDTLEELYGCPSTR